MAKSRFQLFISLVFFASSLALFSLTNSYFAPPTIQAVEVPRISQTGDLAVAPTQELQVEGVWEQYCLIDGQREFMAQLEIRRDGAHYTATPVNIAEGVFPKHTYRSFDHSYTNGVWSFREEWAPGETGEFHLTRLSDNEFVGTANPTNSECGFETLFVRVAD